MTEDEYKREFGIDPFDKRKLMKALEHALDIRKFEIEMYWKRAAYFWALIAAAFAGYFAVIGSEKIPNREFMAYIISCIGFLFTFAWFQVNRGSKHWQENWENHVDMLENKITGPLYKTVLHRPDDGDFFENFVTGPSTISVSKTNQIVSLFTLFIWLFLAYKTMGPICTSLPPSWERTLVGGATLLFAYKIVSKGRTYTGDYTHVANKREANIK